MSGIVFLPENSPLCASLEPVVEAAGLRRLAGDDAPQADFVLADLTLGEGRRALEALTRFPRSSDAPVLALIDPAAPPDESLLSAVSEVLGMASAAEELPFRLRRVQGRREAAIELQRGERDLALLLKLTADYAEALDVEVLLHDVTRRLAERMDIIRASLVLVDEGRGIGVIVAASDDASLRNLQIDLARYPEIREVIRTAKPVIVGDARSHPLLEGVKGEVTAKGILTIAALPLAVGGRVLGVLLVRAAARRGPFSAREVDFLATVAHATAIALRNARLIESVRGETEREKSARIAAEERAAAERALSEELRQTKEFLERLIDSSVDAIIAADMRGRIILFNKGAEAVCGYTTREARARLNAAQLYPPGVSRTLMQRLRQADADGKGRLGLCRQELVTRTGERVPVNMTASIIYEGDREVATVGIFTDLRDRVQLERKLSDVETRLEASEKNAVIVALAGTAAHELNQPLTSVMGYAELLRRKLKEGDFAFRPVDIIYREAERMAEIVRKIGKITRYETTTYMGTKKIVDLEKASSHED